MAFNAKKSWTTRKSVLGFAVSAVILALAITASYAQQGKAISKADRLLIEAQKICPVMGKDLTKMGSPVKAKIGEQTVFLCCKGCFQGKVQKQHWERIQANLMAAQGNCPVMNKPLPESPASTIVQGRQVFVCCPPCTKKIQADTDKYLAKVNELLKENLARREASR